MACHIPPGESSAAGWHSLSQGLVLPLSGAVIPLAGSPGGYGVPPSGVANPPKCVLLLFANPPKRCIVHLLVFGMFANLSLFWVSPWDLHGKARARDLHFGTGGLSFA